jgi:hypothetical protein
MVSDPLCTIPTKTVLESSLSGERLGKAIGGELQASKAYGLALSESNVGWLFSLAMKVSFGE